jgi:DNA mismatch repair ATPase MutS
MGKGGEIMITVRCFSANNQILCVDDFGKNVINLTTKEYRVWMTICEYEKLLDELKEAGAKEIPVSLVEKHKFEIRTYYRIYRVSLENYRYRYFMEIFDGSSATYEYIFCNSRKKCLQIMEEREQGNKMFY